MNTANATADGRYYEYSKAANPIGANLITQVPYHSFLPEIYASGPSRVVPLDLSAELQTDGPATGPGLCAHFVRILSGDSLTFAPNATSMVVYVISGSGRLVQGHFAVDAEPGSFIALPGGQEFSFAAAALSTLY